MKLLLILGSDTTYKTIVEYMKGTGCEFIRYSHVLKAMDNIDEIDPAGIIISARDYPRHWKAFAQFTRSARSREDCPIVLLKGKTFTEDDTTKGLYIGLNGILDEALSSAGELERLRGILERSVAPEEKPVYPGGNQSLLNFVLALPGGDKALVTGEIKAISSARLSFLPDYADTVEGLEEGGEYAECSLRAGEAMLNPVCRLAEIGTNISMEFLSFPEGEEALLKNYLEGFSA